MATQGTEAFQGRAPSAPTAAPVYERKVDAQGRAYATGKRKDAVARVWVKPGKGKVTVNDRDIAVYFARPVLRMLLNQPFLVANRENQTEGGITAWLFEPHPPKFVRRQRCADAG